MRLENRFWAWWLGYPQSLAEVMNRINAPTDEDIERYGIGNILRARREVRWRMEER